MHIAAKIPLFQHLSRFELARIAGDWQELTFEPSERISPQGPALLFVIQGSIQVEWTDGEEQLPCLMLGEGDVWKEEASGQWVLTAGSHCQVGLISWPRMELLLQANQQLAARYLSLISEQRLRLMTDLSKTRQMLKTYAREVWNEVQPIESTRAVASSAAAALPPPTIRLQRFDWAEIRNACAAAIRSHAPRWGGLIASAVVGALTYHFVSLPPSASITVAVLVGASILWFIGAFPDWAVALGATTLLAISGIVSPGVALGGFANPSWFLLLGVLGLGAGVARTGFLYRMALMMLARLPPTYFGQSLALSLTGLLLTPVLPSSNSRCALASPLTLELMHAMGLKPRSKGAAGLGLTAFFGFGQMYFAFLSGANLCLLAWSLMPVAARTEITWLRWFLLVLPLTLLIFTGCFLTTIWLYRPEKSRPVSRATVQNQLVVLGPLTRMERTALGTAFFVLVGFITQDLHGIPSAWIAMVGFLMLVAAGVIDREGLRRMDWGFLLLLGSLIGLSDITTVTGLIDRLSAGLRPLLMPIAPTPFLFLLAVGALTVLIRLAIPLQQSVMIMVLSMLPVGLSMGYHPIVIVLTILAFSNTWILPQINSMYLTVFSGTEEQTFDHRQARPLSFIHLLIGLLGLLITVPYWSFLGLLPG